ncbi:NAD-dependent histone deacetylase-like protein SIR2 [Byssothecium circinans]|uniref:NAD-dependent histone deacetylase-like protein SIR2 n=1 Tax=Byssothecium circinans TaxID=147558 RepID=A0A6A5TLY0_9PLEO|nr:NAD-dependent histone deacetylase-like protein SIR2 [Byssothecium circinans]
MAWRASPQESEPASSPLSDVPASLQPPSPSYTSDSELSEVSNVSALSPSRRYLTPASSNRSSAKASPAPDNMALSHSSNDEGRPRKKRKLADPKDRTTTRLDLRKSLTEADRPQLDRLLKTLHKKRKIVVIAGAGISVAAGIPDFRSSTGLFKSLRNEHKRISSGKDLFDASVYQDDHSTSSFHDMVRNLSQQTKNAQPTEFHHLLATLAHEGRLLRLYTQNVDGIDTALEPLRTEVPLPKKNPWPKTVQLHGGLDHMVCSKCHALSDFDAEKFDGPVPPECSICVENDSVRKVAEKRSHGIGRLRPRMVLYNEHNPDDEAIGACVSADLRTRPDAIIVAGTTLKVPGVRRITREMCATVKGRKDGVNIWINNDPEPISKDLADLWDLVIQGPCDEVARHAALPHWDNPISYKNVSDGEIPKYQPAVVIGTPRKVLKVQGHLTPGQSPRMAPHSFYETAIKVEPFDQPDTPSKRGTKRKPDAAKPSAFEKMNGTPLAKVPRRTQPQSKKAAGAKSKAKKDTKPKTTLITDTMKTKKDTSARQSVAIKIKQSKYSVAIPPPPTENVDTIHIDKLANPVTPKRDQARVTKLKKDLTLAQLAYSDPRNNHSPKQPERPEMEGFTPVKRTPSEQLQQEQDHAYFYNVSPTSDSRPTSAGSRTSITMKDILNPEQPC